MIFSQRKSKSHTLFDTISKRYSNIDTSYWKQTPIIMISTIYEGVFDKVLCFDINKINLGITLECLGVFDKYSIAKKSFVFLETPYKSSCSYYDSSQTVFNSSSHKHCIR